jgi:phage-related protein
MTTQKPVVWIGSSKDDLRAFPDEVSPRHGVCINDAQNGDEHPRAKALKGFGGRSVLEVVDDEDGDTYRAVYTVRFAGIIYVLHAFQEKSKRGIETPKHDVAVIQARLKTAEAHYQENYGKGGKK